MSPTSCSASRSARVAGHWLLAFGIFVVAHHCRLPWIADRRTGPERGDGRALGHRARAHLGGASATCIAAIARRRVNAHCRRARDRPGRGSGRRNARDGEEDEGARRRGRGRARCRDQVRHSRCRILPQPARASPRGAARDADVVLKVRRPASSELSATRKVRSSSRIMDPYGQEAAVKAMADAGVAAFAMELMPRITRAQVMDVLSSQANLAGYRAVIDGAAEYGRALADDDDGGRHRPGRQGVRHGRGGRRPAGDRDRPPARRHRHRHRRAPRRQGAGRKPRRQVHRGRGRGVQAGRDRRRLRQGDVEGVPGQAGRARRRPHQQAGYRHHHRADPRSSGAAAGIRARWWPRCGRAR